MFRLASPLFLLLIFIPLLILFSRFRMRNRGHIRVSGLEEMAHAVPPSLMVRVSQILPVLKALALILIITALARPQWGEQKTRVTSEGVNIILALDLSESMSAYDFKKDDRMITRLDAVKNVVREFIMKREGDRIGMVVFGSHAFTQIPLTRDYGTIAFILDRLEIGAAGPRTAIGDAIGISLKRLEDIPSQSNLIILLTDGKSNSGSLSWQDGVKIAADRRVKIHAVGVGTRGEAPFLVNDGFGKRYVYQKVDTDPETLKAIAEKTGGRYFEAGDLRALADIYEMIDRLEKTEVAVDKWVAYQELYPGVLSVGLALLLVHAVLSGTRCLRIP